MNLRSLAVLVLSLCGAASVLAQDTFFFSDFEFGGDTGLNIFEVSELNDMDDLVGEWTGSEPEFPTGDGSGRWTPDSAGIEENPFGGSVLFIDRPIANHTLFANLTETIQNLGAIVSFEVGTRRTGGGGAKDYDFFGLDAEGNESFRVRVLTGGPERLGYVLGENAITDLPTVEGDDQVNDIDNSGGPPWTEADPIVNVSITLGGTGYTISMESLNGSNSYVTEQLPFNGSATELAQVGLFYQGVEGATGQQSGFFIDKLRVEGFEELLQGDFDANGTIDMADFVLLADNFNKSTSVGDYDFSGTVDLLDFVGFKSAYLAAQQPAGAAAVPEPAAAMLLWLAMGLGLRCRTRRLS